MTRKNAKSFAHLAAAVCFVAASAAASAAEGSGFYVGAGVGEATNKADDIGFSASDTAFKLFAGYSFNRYFATELTYVDAGSPNERIGNASVEISASGFLAAAIAKLPLGERFALFGKLGYAFYDSRASLQVGSSRISEKESDQDFAYGVGASLYLGSHFALRVEYENVDIPDGEFSIVSASGILRF